jgi:sugar (pentulose or hexulose) kinase
VRAVGGGLRSPIWLDILGKILGKPITTISNPDTANLGNIMLCGKALGYYPTYKDAVNALVTTDRQVAYPEGSEVYEKKYPLFLDLYQSLKPNFTYLAKYCED